MRVGRRQMVLGLGGAVALATGPASAATPVDLALVLAADCSFSVDMDEYALQQQGYAKAFRHPTVVAAIVGRRIAMTYFQWSGATIQSHVLPWTVPVDEADLYRWSDALARAPRTVFRGGTSISGAIDFGRHLLNAMPFEAMRRVIDISGDGRTNNGRSTAKARDEAVAEDIVINGLPIVNEEPDVDIFYETQVIGGPGAFMEVAADFAAFEDAIRRKLIQEISAPAPARDRVPT